MRLFGHSPIPALFSGLFDDAALFPPENASMPDAVRRHGQHKHGWYGAAVGWFVCSASRLTELDEAAQHTRFGDVNLALTVPTGIADLTAARTTAAEYGWIRLRSL